MKSRWTPTRWAPKSSAPATEKQSTPLTPTTARRWPCVRRQRLADPPGVEEQQRPADRERHQHQPQPQQRGGVGGQPEEQPVPEQPDQRSWPRRPRAATNQIRSAIRPTRWLPATSWAEPGSTQRHQHQRDGAAEPDARGAVAGGEARDRTVVRPGGRNGWHRDASHAERLERGRVVLTASITSHTRHSRARRAGSPCRIRGLPPAAR